MKIAICPGSFDPITLGHKDIIERASQLFDKVIVLVLNNSSKKPVFSLEERMDFIKRCVNAENVEIDTYSGLLVDYAREHNASALIKGLRAVSDFDYEFQLALINKSLYPKIETLFLPAKGENMFLSSSMVKEVCSLGGDISSFVPQEILNDIYKRCKGDGKNDRTNTDILLEDLEDVLDDATSIPLSKKYAVDVDKIKTIIEDIRLNTPQETKQAKAIVDSRNNILEEAKKEAADIIAKAQEEARELVARDQITQTAQAEAADIIAKAKEQGDSYIADAQNQASDILGNATNQANEMVTTAQNKSREMLTAVNNYADDTLLSIDDSLYKALADVRRIRKGIEDTQNKNK